MRYLTLLCCLFITAAATAQKKPLDHSVYDGWQSIGERFISNNGQYVVYSINPQEGDGTLVIQRTDNSYKKEVPRGYSATITEDSRFVIFRIRPFFKDTRDARIKKKRPDEMPKDSLAIVELGKDSVVKIARVKNYKTPEKGSGWVAYHLEKAVPETPRPAAQPDSVTRLNNLLRMADSLARVADSIRNKANEAKTKGMTILQPARPATRPAPRAAEEPIEEGTELVVRNLYTGEEKKYKLVNEFFFTKNGNRILIETSRKNNDSLTKATVYWVSTADNKADTILQRFNDAKNYAFDEAGTQVAFVAERDSSSKALQKFYKLYYYKTGMDSAAVRAHRNSNGIAKGLMVSADYNNNFSKDGSRLFFGLAPIRPVKDTTLVDFETARLDVWHYNDDYLQPQQQVQLQRELRKSYLAIATDNGVLPLADENCENVIVSNEGNGAYALGLTDKGNRVQQQWDILPQTKVYLITVANGSRKLVLDKIQGSPITLSPDGKFISWYSWKEKNWFTYNISTSAITNITKTIKVPLFDEDDDHPAYPPPHGLMRWQEGDAFVYVYDKYDIWKCDPTGATPPVCITNGAGRKNNISYRNLVLDREERFVKNNQTLLLEVFNNTDKSNGLQWHTLGSNFTANTKATQPNSFAGYLKAKNANELAYLIGSPASSYNMAISNNSDNPAGQYTVLSSLNPQQNNYNWFTVELQKWKLFDGKESEGLLFKPENFDPNKKYPVIFYFYERDADTRYNYRAPAPSASTINIPWFTSNGYLVFDPNIYYKTGQPGDDAYNSVVSAARYLAKMPFVDSTKMAIQGQSWGGYQVAYLVTKTKLFAAAGAGAPVANMTSAYGGIRWGTGVNRQFQYEKSQSRIGATLWEKPEAYIKNSPLFKADKITTPLLIMHNDKDGAVPWYQGIEFFTALRRLNKKVWLLQYNDEDHNLVERRNRKDLSIRLGQFFDHYLKGATAPRWMTDGVPAALKGIDWGVTPEAKKGF